jgi:pimeloyl-ACP methyl ester carboxylesterase
MSKSKLKAAATTTTKAKVKSSCKVIATEDAGHFIYLQKPDLSLNAVIDFMDSTTI